MSKQLNWGILTTGAIARCFANGVKHSRYGKVVAVGSRSKESADAFADEFDIPNRHADYEALLADPEVQAVYIATPHPMHPQWAIAAARAGKHVLCEKPAGLNQWQAMAMIEAARRHGVFFMEAFMYRCHPQTARLVELIRDRVIGDVQVITASFGFRGGNNPESRLLNPELGGGGMLDVGCYPVSMSRLVAGAAQGEAFANPTKVTGAGHLGETGVDEWAAGVLKFEGGIIAQVATGCRAALANNVVIRGTDGVIEIPDPWMASRGDAPQGRIIVKTRDKTDTIDVPSELNSFSLEADRVAEAIAAGKTQVDGPAMTWDDTMGNLATLDQWREAVGLTYPHEKPEHTTPVHGGKLAVRSDHNMQYARIDGLDKPISRFLMGCDNQKSFSQCAVMFDEWYECGGNAFDTAFIYGGGRPEGLLGRWIKSRGVRDETVVLTKGAHTPECYPEALKKQFHESLDRLGYPNTDMYAMHRDNLDVPVGEFIDVLNELVDAGLVSVFGGSNWSLERIAEANAYAKANGRQGFSFVNNNLSLAEMVDGVWKGCIHVSDPESRRWLAEHNMPHFSWSSQARGFFTDRAGRDKTDDAELNRCWYSELNFKRRDRAIELAEKKGVLPINICAAWVIGQAFASFALIGPRNLYELHTSLPAMDVELTPKEMAWLACED